MLPSTVYFYSKISYSASVLPSTVYGYSDLCAALYCL